MPAISRPEIDFMLYIVVFPMFRCGWLGYLLINAMKADY
jgi:hypothetical protein